MAESDSPLSSAPSTDDEAMEQHLSKATGLDRYFKPAPKQKEMTPEPPRRAPSPPHEYTLADNDAIAFLVMFRSRFADAFPRSCPHIGPQDIERGVSEDLPSEGVERLLCALLGLVLNRKKDVEYDMFLARCKMLSNTASDEATMVEPLKMLSPRISTNGLPSGRARIPYTAAKHSTTWMLLSE
jgi:hypothetical protein